MTLTVKRPCICNNRWYLEEIEPHLVDSPWLCVWCNGSKEMDEKVSFSKYQGKFKNLNFRNTCYYNDMFVEIECQCGNRCTFVQDDTIACKCGRVYRLSTSIKVDETYLGRSEQLIKLYEKQEK